MTIAPRLDDILLRHRPSPEASSFSTMRRARVPSEERMASRKSGSVPLRAMTRRSVGIWSRIAARARGTRFDDVLEGEEQAFQDLRRLRSRLGQAVEHVLHLVALHLVDDVGHARMRIDAHIAGEIQHEVLVQRLLDDAHGFLDHGLEGEHAPHQRVAHVLGHLAHHLGRAGGLHLGEDQRRRLGMLLLQIGCQNALRDTGDTLPDRAVGIARSPPA